MTYFVHGLTDSPTYAAWHNMRLRGVVAAWRSFEGFLADMGVKPAGTRLVRFDCKQPYGPGNAHWALAGATKHPLHSVWKSMIARCYNSQVKSFPNYGARGITVCAEWRQSFSAFVRDMGERPEGYTIDRQNNDLGYSPDNCVWATRLEQTHNRRTPVRRAKLNEGVTA
jgi:hypothetical protein